MKPSVHHNFHTASSHTTVFLSFFLFSLGFALIAPVRVHTLLFLTGFTKPAIQNTFMFCCLNKLACLQSLTLIRPAITIVLPSLSHSESSCHTPLCPAISRQITAHAEINGMECDTHPHTVNEKNSFQPCDRGKSIGLIPCNTAHKLKCLSCITSQVEVALSVVLSSLELNDMLAEQNFPLKEMVGSLELA